MRKAKIEKVKIKPSVVDTCIWKNPNIPIEEKIRKCKECYARNDMNQHEIGWCNFYIQHGIPYLEKRLKENRFAPISEKEIKNANKS